MLSAIEGVLRVASTTHDAVSLYLHVPFCTARCSYCAFNVYTHMSHRIDAYVDALVAEVAYAGAQRPGTQVHTVYFGGGTPTLLPGEAFARVLGAVQQAFAVQPGVEITAEANPNDLHPALLSAMRAAGVNRLSIGMQSANAHELALFTRQHDAGTVAQAVAQARTAGFANLSLDLIYGAPGQTLADWQASLEAALALRPEHVSLYGLELKEGTALRAWVERGRVPTPDDDLAADMFDHTVARMAEAGFSHYEISNWALPGRESRHNLQYWHSLPYLGLGPGAHGWADGVRYATVRLPQQYIQRMTRADQLAPLAYPCTPTVDWHERLSREEAMAEALLMGLRLVREGVSRPAFAARFGVDVLARHHDVLHKHAGWGLVGWDDERLWLTPRGLLLSNVVFRDLLPDD